MDKSCVLRKARNPTVALGRTIHDLANLSDSRISPCNLMNKNPIRNIIVVAI